MDSMASFHQATGGHYITTLPADSLLPRLISSYRRARKSLGTRLPCWLVSIHITWHFCSPVSMVKDAMEWLESIY